MINQMLNTGIFPDKLKQSKVTPIFKANDKELLSNYRPISVLSSMSKLYEYAISDQLTQYLIDNNLFSSNQYGFRAQHSTELAALNICRPFDILNGPGYNTSEYLYRSFKSI